MKNSVFQGFLGCGTRIRTQTNRVRVCRATVTQFRNLRFISTAHNILAPQMQLVKWFLIFFIKLIFHFAKTLINSALSFEYIIFWVL